MSLSFIEIPPLIAWILDISMSLVCMHLSPLMSIWAFNASGMPSWSWSLVILCSSVSILERATSCLLTRSLYNVSTLINLRIILLALAKIYNEQIHTMDLSYIDLLFYFKIKTILTPSIIPFYVIDRPSSYI